MAKNVSYLRARDPSILAFFRPDMEKVRTNLIPELNDESTESRQTENLRIYLRIKKCCDFNSLYTISGDTLICNVPQNSNCMRNMKDGDSVRKMYTFSTIFDPNTSQSEIFNRVVKPKILDFINGENSTLLTYGASGSGKTFTVIGTDIEPGIVPRSLEYLFRTLPQLSKNPMAKPLPSGDISILSVEEYKREKQLRKNLLNASSLLIDKSQHVKTYTAMQERLSGEPVAILEESTNVSLTIWVSFAEIYNEQIYDLLQPDPPRGKQRTRLRLGCSNGHIYIKNLTNISVSSGLEAYQILQFGIHNLNYASTSLNEHSSRSHFIFTIKLVQVYEIDGGTHISSFNFCDLAGSERSKKTMNVGDRLKESNNINSSLLVLGRCISAIRNAQKNNESKLIPFRESKLTQLFQKALAGHEDIAMIVNISPKLEMFDETQHVLNFAAVAKDIAIDRKPIAKKQTRFSLLVERKNGITEETTTNTSYDIDDDVEQLRNAVLFLESELQQQRTEFEIQERLNRDHILNETQRLLKEKEESVNERVKEAQEYATKLYEIKLETMRKKYEKLLKEEADRNTVIINLDDSDDEATEQLKEMIEVLKQQVVVLEKRVSQYKFDFDRKEQECLELREKNKKLGEDLIELRRTLDDGVTECLQLRNDNTKTEAQLLMLQQELELYSFYVASSNTDSESNHEDETNENNFDSHRSVIDDTSSKLMNHSDSFPTFPNCEANNEADYNVANEINLQKDSFSRQSVVD